MIDIDVNISSSLTEIDVDVNITPTVEEQQTPERGSIWRVRRERWLAGAPSGERTPPRWDDLPRVSEERLPAGWSRAPTLLGTLPGARQRPASRARSSVGRAPPWHGGGRRFDPDRVHPTFPLVRACFGRSRSPAASAPGHARDTSGTHLSGRRAPAGPRDRARRGPVRRPGTSRPAGRADPRRGSGTGARTGPG